MKEQEMAGSAGRSLELRAMSKFKEMQQSLATPGCRAQTGNLSPPVSSDMHEQRAAGPGRQAERAKDEEQTRAEAWSALADCLTDENYQYLISNWDRVTDVHNGLLEECVHAALEPVERLKEACDSDDPAQMALYTDLPHDPAQLEFCRVSVREAEYLKYYSALVLAVAEWCRTFLKGGNSPKWTDGRN